MTISAAVEQNGFTASGNITVSGTWEQYASDGSSSPTAYSYLHGANKTISGGGIYTNVWLHFKGSTTFSGIVNSGEIEKTYVGKVFSIADGITYKTNYFENQSTSNLVGSSIMEVSGDFLNSSTFNMNTSNVKFTGTSPQNITTGMATFYNVNIEGGGAKTLQDEMFLTGTATFTDGDLITASDKLLVFSSGSFSSGANDNSHVDGPCKKIGNTDFIFPLGDQGELRELGISAITDASDEFIAEAFKAKHVSVTNVGAPLTNVSELYYWDLDQSVGSNGAKVELFWDLSSEDGIDDCGDLTIAHYFVSPSLTEKWWEEPSTTVTGADCSASGSGSIKTDNVITQFSPFGFGSKSGGANPLPTELLIFKGTIQQQYNALEWVTA